MSIISEGSETDTRELEGGEVGKAECLDVSIHISLGGEPSPCGRDGSEIEKQLAWATYSAAT